MRLISLLECGESGRPMMALIFFSFVAVQCLCLLETPTGGQIGGPANKLSLCNITILSKGLIMGDSAYQADSHVPGMFAVGLRRGCGGGANGCKDSDIGKPYGYLFRGESVAGRDIFI
jgi:hypothetical protein